MLTACNVLSVQWLTITLRCSVLNGKHITCSQPAWLVSFSFLTFMHVIAMHRGHHRLCSAFCVLHVPQCTVLGIVSF